MKNAFQIGYNWTTKMYQVLQLKDGAIDAVLAENKSKRSINVSFKSLQGEGVTLLKTIRNIVQL